MKNEFEKNCQGKKEVKASQVVVTALAKPQKFQCVQRLGEFIQESTEIRMQSRLGITSCVI